MANNYSQWSESIDGLSDEELAWFKEAFSYEAPEDADPKSLPAWYDLDAEGVGFDYDIRPGAESGEHSVWFYAEEWGNLDTLGELVVEFIRKFRPDYVFQLTWSESCSKLRLGEFGGGGMVCSRLGCDVLNTYSWCNQKAEEVKNRMKTLDEV